MLAKINCDFWCCLQLPASVNRLIDFSDSILLLHFAFEVRACCNPLLFCFSLAATFFLCVFGIWHFGSTRCFWCYKESKLNGECKALSIWFILECYLHKMLFLVVWKSINRSSYGLSAIKWILMLMQRFPAKYRICRMFWFRNHFIAVNTDCWIMQANVPKTINIQDGTSFGEFFENSSDWRRCLVPKRISETWIQCEKCINYIWQAISNRSSTYQHNDVNQIANTCVTHSFFISFLLINNDHSRSMISLSIKIHYWQRALIQLTKHFDWYESIS